MDKKQVFGRLEEINASLGEKYVAGMGIKGNKAAKKAIMTSLQDCRERLSRVISELRSVSNLSNLSNTVVANLYDAAYKGINKGGLRKMIDKRALQNEAMYQKIDKELAEIVAKQDAAKIQEQNKEVIEDVGDCAFSVMNAAEAMQESDCMCISLSVERPESAIADPTKLIVKDVFPTYITADSFLQSAQFNISQNGDQAHGGFSGEAKPKGAGAQLAMGVAREDVTAVMPLFLFKAHWAIAKRKLQPLFGMMCTLDVMGYQSA